MSKVICDICGTAYQETAEQCPICGCSRDLGIEDMIDEDILLDSSAVQEKGGRFASGRRRQKEIFDYDEANSGEEEPDEDEGEEFEEPKSNTVLVVLLVALITLLLAATGYIFLRYLLPNMMEPKPTIAETAGTWPLETVEVTTTTPVIPCEGLVMTGGLDTLTMEGGHWLLHVRVTPEDTTDTLQFVSEDESVVIVDENGRLTATGEGETYVNILCGQQKLRCHVVVDYSLATEAALEQETIPAMTSTQTEPVEEETHTDPKKEETEQTVASTAPLKDVTLKLKRTDISLGVGYSYTIPLDCELSYEEIQWSVEEPYVAKVENGTVTALHSGVTDVVARYGDQVVECRVRCG